MLSCCANFQNSNFKKYEYIKEWYNPPLRILPPLGDPPPALRGLISGPFEDCTRNGLHLALPRGLGLISGPSANSGPSTTHFLLLFTWPGKYACSFCLYLQWFTSMDSIFACIYNSLRAWVLFLLVFTMGCEHGFHFLLVFTMVWEHICLKIDKIIVKTMV